MIADLAIIKMAIDLGLTVESGAIAFLGWQMFKMNKHLMGLITAHDKRITLLENKTNG
ncbi:hypothetical protein [Aliivibrio fischeri]|uniref:hypothetical protein n=1 Tax=Aliivibrio fischeri TaxID=668 RepID=UPI000AE9B312|nr:hypothetical protein [Aliivibrio fischeri]